MLEVVVEEEGEGLLLRKLTVERAIEVVNFCFHASERFEEEVGVAAEQIPQVNLGQVWAVLFDQVKLFVEHILSTLESHLGEYVDHGNDLTCFHLVLNSQVVKKCDECL